MNRRFVATLELQRPDYRDPVELRARNWAAAADQFLRWDKAANPWTGQKERLTGLTRRRQAERELFLRDGLPG